MAIKPIFGRMGTASFMVALAVLLANSAAAWWSIDKLVHNNAWVTHTHEVLAELQVLLPALADADRSQGNAPGSESDSSLLSSGEALSRAGAALTRLEGLTADNAGQQKRLLHLRGLIADRFGTPQGDAARSSDWMPPVGAPRERTLARPQWLAETRRQITAMEEEEQALLCQRDRESRTSARVTYLAQAVATVLAVAVLGLVVSLARRDARERQRSVEALRASEGRFRQLADALPNLVWMARADGCTDYHNRRWYEYTGLPEGIEGDDSFVPAVHPEDALRCLDTWHTCVRTGQLYQIEYRLRDRAGCYR
jgi:PAS domain-containing protein